MSIDHLWTIADVLFPPFVLALFALFVVISSIAHAVLRRNPRAIVFIIGGGNFLFLYVWLYTAGPDFTQRGVAMRLAFGVLLTSIAIYNERAWPWLSDFIYRLFRRLRGQR